MARDDQIERIYRDFGDVVLRRARQILRHDDEAIEVMQEVFTSLLERPHQFEGRSQITTWLYSATTHASLNRIRNRKTRARILADHVAPEARLADGPRAENLAALRQLLELLPDELAQVAIYYYLDEMTQAEIARVMDCSRRHVGDLLERAQAAARKAMVA